MIVFSFIVPVYNVEGYIDICVRSILNQKLENIEIILVDDGSTDNSGKICDEYMKYDSRVKVIHQPNLGQAIARNTGMSAAKGNYFIFIDSDDYWNENTLSLLEEKIIRYNPDLLVFNYETFECNTKRTVGLQLPLHLFEENTIKSGEDYLTECLSNNVLYPWYAWLYVIKKDLLIENNFFFSEGIKYEDVELMFKIILKSQSVICVNKVIYHYLLGRNGATTSISSCNVKTEKDKLDIMCRNIMLVQKLNISQKLKTLLCSNFSCLWYSTLFLCNAFNTRKEKENIIKILYETMYICKYTTAKPQKYIYFVTKILGIKNATIILNLVRTIRNVIQHSSSCVQRRKILD